MALRTVLALTALATGVAFTVTPSKKPLPTPLKRVAQGTRAVNVTRLYNDTCAKCHGEQAAGNGASTHTLITREKFDQSKDRPFFDAIKKGVPEAGMDAYGETMSDEEIWALVVHIRELQAKGLREAEGDPKPDASGVFHGKRENYRVETVVDQGLATPWAVDWLPDGRMLVTNIGGKMQVDEAGKLTDVEGMPTVRQLGQGGLMDVAVHPDYRRNGWIYLAFTDPAKNDPRAGLTKIVRGKLRFEGGTPKWTEQQTIFEADQKFYTGAGIHFGCRIVFDGKGHVFFPVGERGGNMLAQELTNPFGKIYRVNEDGSIPADNPYNTAEAKAKGVLPAIWTYGHRNPQGLVLALDGALWDTEHAPRGGDELNRIQKGANYGWPVVCYGINYNDSPFRTPWPKPEQKITMPVLRWLPSIAACGLDVSHGKGFGGWKGDLFAGGLAGATVERIRVKDDKVVEREELIHGMGRVRDVVVGPEGSVYVVLNQPDKIIRLVPAK